MDVATVREFRAACVGKHPGSEQEEMVLDVIDGELAAVIPLNPGQLRC